MKLPRETSWRCSIDLDCSLFSKQNRIVKLMVLIIDVVTVPSGSLFRCYMLVS